MSAPVHRTVARLAVALGLAPHARVEEALADPRAGEGPPGRFLVEQGILTVADLERVREILRVAGGEPEPPEMTAPTQAAVPFSAAAQVASLPSAERPPDLPPIGADPDALSHNDKYDRLVEVGRGGMGIVYRARQKGLDRSVALKVLPCGGQSSPEQVTRFHREAHAAARLHHPGIVEIYDVGELAGCPYIAMEFVEGLRLDEHVRRHELDLRARLDLLRKVAEAVDHAHREGVVHRDLKPANVLVDRTGRPKVADFGLAKEVSDPTRERLTVSGMVVGTPHYMSPEQAEGRTDVDARSDVYSLGAMLYELLTGRTPYVADNVIGMLMMILSDEIVPPRRTHPKVHLDLETVCMRALAREPGRRYPTAGAFAEDLRRFLDGEPIEARPPTLRYRAVRAIRRHKAATALVALALCVPVALYAQKRVTDARRRLEAGQEAGRKVAEGRAHLQAAAALVAEGKPERATERWRDAEGAFAAALGADPDAEAAHAGLRDARRTRLLNAAQVRIAQGQFADAGEWLREAEAADPGHAETARLKRVQEGTARLAIDVSEPDTIAWFLRADPAMPWLAEALPPLERAQAAGMLERLGPVPLAPTDRPFGDGLLVLVGPGGVVATSYLHVPRNAEVRIACRRLRVDAGGGGDFRTLAEAIATAVPGTTVEVAAGAYPESVRIAVANLSLVAAEGARPEIGSEADGTAIAAENSPGLRVQGFHLRSGSGPVVHVAASPGAAILDNEVQGGTGTGIEVTGCPNAVVAGNQVHDGKEPGIGVSDSEGAAVVANHVHHTGWTGIFVSGRGVVIAGNLVHDNSRGGIMTHHSEACEFLENVVFGHKEWGIIAGENSSRITIQDNVVWNIDPGQEQLMGRGLQLAGSSGGKVVHNTVVACRIGIMVQQSYDSPCTDNIIVGAAMGFLWHDGGLVDYNCLWQNQLYGRWIEKDARTREEMKAFYSWKTGRGLEHGVEDDPRFADLAHADFRLAADSPCRNVGSDGTDLGARWDRVVDVREQRADRKARLVREIVRRYQRLAAAEKDGERAARLARQGLAVDPEDPTLRERAGGPEPRGK